MDYKFEELIDIDKIKEMVESFYFIFKAPVSIADNNGTMLMDSGLEDICAKFHKNHPIARKKCNQSDQYLLKHMEKGHSNITYKCFHGLTDIAIPIIVEGQHIASFFTGQFFLEAPDMGFYKKLAKEYGFDEKEYLAAVSKVQILTQEQVMRRLAFFKKFSIVFGEMAEARLQDKRAEGEVRNTNASLEKMIAERTYQLEEINATLEEEIAERVKIEEKIRKLNEELEQKVAERTSQLQEMNASLEVEISERMEVEVALRREVAFSNALLENVHGGIVACDAEGKFVLFNRTVREWYGIDAVPENQASTEHFKDLYCPDGVTALPTDATPLIRALNGERLDNVGVVIRAKDQPIRHILVNGGPFFDREGKKLGAVVALRDITTRKQNEKLVLESNKKLTILYELYSKATQKMDLDLFIQETISTLQQKLDADGVTFFLVDGQDLLFHSSVGLSADLVQTIATREIVDSTFGLTLLTGKPHFFKIKDFLSNTTRDVALQEGFSDVAFYPLMASNKAIGVIGIGNKSDRVIDEASQEVLLAVSNLLATLLRNVQLFVSLEKELIERKRTEEDLKKAKEVAERANIAKSQFLANMSHEIRTPMNGIIGMTDLALLTDMDEEQKEYLSIVKTSTKVLLRVVNDILDYSKIEAGKLNLENYPFKLSEIVSDVIVLFDIHAKQKGLCINTMMDRVPTFLIGDAVRLRQVLSNLIGNAVKFTDRGSITLQVHCAELRENDITLKFVVVDTGIGIARENLHKLFKCFSQVDESNTRQFGGTGLGLAISKNLVEKMGGELWVESQEGVGSEFSFTVVLEHECKSVGNDQEEELEDELEDLKTKENKRILLAEDDEVSRALANIYLQKKGYEVIMAQNGIEAVLLFEKGDYDLVLMDINMPYMNGYEATAVIREKEEMVNMHIPIIAMTAYALSGDREKCIAAGMDDYITKPIDINKLSSMVDRWLTR